MTSKTAIFILFFIIWVGPVAAVAEVKTSRVYKYYDVTLDDDSMTKSIFSSTPIFHKGGKFAGLTSYQIRYQYTYTRPTIGMCRLATVDITCDCAITLPRLTGGDAELKRLFENYLSRLDEHERRHCDIAINHANMLDAELKAVRDEKCDRFVAELKARYEKIMEEVASAQARYDHETQHGKYEGVDIKKYDDRRREQQKPAPAPGGQGLQSLDDSDGSGLYRDADGVWRNY